MIGEGAWTQRMDAAELNLGTDLQILFEQLDQELGSHWKESMIDSPHKSTD